MNIQDVKPGDQVWLIRKGLSVGIKLVCPDCRGVGFAGDIMIPCNTCDGYEYIRKEVPTFEVVGAVKVRSVTHTGEHDDPVVEILRPPLFLLDAYGNNVIEMCKDYWDDFEKGRSHAGAYPQTIRDLSHLTLTYEEAVERANELTNYHIQDACDQEKTVLYDRPEDVFRQTAVGQAQADTVEIFKETAIEEALC